MTNAGAKMAATQSQKRMDRGTGVGTDWQKAVATLGLAILVGLGQAAALCAQTASPAVNATQGASSLAEESRLLTGVRQITFEGKRAGEGYFSRDGRMMVFQSERDPANPFYQIYLMDFATGDIERISPGIGKTTCAWIHPDGSKVLFASTHEDPQAADKQAAELKERESGTTRRYSWDYDETYDLYRYDLKQKTYTNLTNTRGYDAEGSWSPNGSLIAFASNRAAYASPLSETMQQRLEMDPSYFVDLYLMDSAGNKLKRLTDTPGYDGGPFFSPDATHLCWRRFTEDGARAELMSMRLDGTDVRSLTKLGAMSWAPFYHPSGKYLIFTTNVHGFANFELYLVDAQGEHEPVRVTYTDGFDGLPVFTPDGNQLSWTSNRTPNGNSQIFSAEWNHHRALELLGLPPEDQSSEQLTLATVAAVESMKATQPDCSPQDILRHVDYLCRPELRGRRTGTEGERAATAYVAAYLDQLGLTPAGDEGAWYQSFDFTSGVSLGQENRLAQGDRSFTVEQEWTPLAFSGTGDFSAANIVFAGYGIVAPESEGNAEYDSFVHLDVKDKWILAFRFMPENITAERRQHLARHASTRFKAMVARDKGAHGLIFVSGPNSSVREELMRLQFDGSLSSASLPILSVSDQVAEEWLKPTGKTLKELQDSLDGGEPQMGFELPNSSLSAHIDIEQVTRQGRNVLGRLMAGTTPSAEVLVVGAHVDHLGEGQHGSSLAKPDEREGIHYGADDNASGVAGMLEIAQWLTTLKAQGKLELKRDILFAAWSGEEDGLIGSSHFIKTLPNHASPHGGESAAAPPAPIYPQIAACLNLDMVGRLDKKLILQGVGSSTLWRSEIERRNAVLGLPITLQDDSYIPTDASAFFIRGVPILSAFTGSHEEYHTPRDTPDKLNYEGAAKIARFMALVARSVAIRDQAPDYQAQQGPESGQPRAALRAYLGTVPDYAESDVKGVKLSSVAATGPAAAAGVQGGDVIIELAGRKIENIYDYTYAIEALKIGQPAKIIVKRNGKDIEMQIVPASRQ